MRKILTAFLLLLTTLSFGQKINSEKTEIPFKLSPNGHILISAEVNGVEGQFVFDTGAGLNLVTKDFADKIKTLQKTSHFYTGHRATGEALQADLWIAKSLTLNEYHLTDQNFAVYEVSLPFAGLISLTAFQNQPVTIDFDKKILIVESAQSLQKRISDEDFEMPISINNDRDITIDISTKIQLNDSLNLEVGLDSGAGFDVYRFNSRYMETLGIDSSQVKHKTKPSYFKPEKSNTYYFTKLNKLTNRNNNVTVQDFKVTFIDGLIYEGIMGINWIGRQITIDLPNKRLIVKK